MLTVSDIREKLIESGLKITPQRLVVLTAVVELNNHPSADQIIDEIKANHPDIAVGTIYKTLETFVDKGLITKVNTVLGVMRYDADISSHHHLYYSNSGQIDDYFDDELNQMIDDYFKDKKIPNFKIESIKLQIIGKKSEP
jgi:Fur family transcriptional regulator, peroxide stress response regulator